MSRTPDQPDEVEMDCPDVEHRHRVDRRIERAMNEGARTWNDLLTATEGADPRLLADRLQVGGRTIEGLEAPTDPPVSCWSPELHARDFEWYFTADCAENLAKRAVALDRRVLCMGTPTVAFALLEHSPLERLTLVDRNPLVTRRHPRSAELETIHEDLAAVHLDAGLYDVALFDAPWYPESLRRWLAVAAHAVRPGGRVLFALLPRLHRPAAQRDRDALLAEARRIGTVDVEAAVLSYQTPRFEREALRAAGLPVPDSWRRADLVSVRVNRAPRPDRLTPDPVEPAWARFVIGDQVVHLDRRAPDEPGDPLSPIDERPDFRYASISTRDPQRERIGLWTSRSRVARVRRPAVIAALLERLADTGDLRALDDAPALTALEKSEQRRLRDGLRTMLGSA